MDESASAYTCLKSKRQVTYRFTALLDTCLSALALALVAKPRSAGYGNWEIYLHIPSDSVPLAWLCICCNDLGITVLFEVYLADTLNVGSESGGYSVRLCASGLPVLHNP